MQLPFSTMIIFLLLALAFIIFSISPLLGDESPTSKILLLIRKKKQMSYDQIKTKFSNEKLIKKRLDQMMNLGWIKHAGRGYKTKDKGRRIADVIHFYRKILGWSSFG